MAEPLPPDQFALLMARAGISLPPAEVEDLRHAHAKLQAMLEMLRSPAPPLAAEPGFTFSTER
ncbi:hypothetical protein [Sediminicoccus sp. KRV36]|uniref:hypothetical protein n=1 Tax=Sediminicoccus sp. KRV36 TaxID=3133721 RepID=UPI00200FE8C9|nr:hypothetical protein [Sediminicoccus rosea]UPY39039.1 hypothetical protein LHU95_10205 [Sediminicoccus rosea]